MMAPLTGTERTSLESTDRARDLGRVKQALENRIVRQRLIDLGLSRPEVDRRLSRLSDEQVHQVALKIDQQNPAGDTTGILLIAAAVVLFVVLIASLLKAADEDDDRDDDDNVRDIDTPGPAAPAPGSQTGPETIIVK